MEKAYTKQIKQFGKEIKHLRKVHSITQIDLAAKCAVDIRTIQRIEKGDYGIGLHILFALAAAFELNPHQLLTTISINKEVKQKQ